MIIHGDSLEELKKLDTDSIDFICTDPPYGYSFMGKHWDKAVPSMQLWMECLRVLKPGGFINVMSAPRSDVLSRMIVNIEDAGFRVDFTPIYWTYASGFPKAGNIGKLVDKRAEVNTEVTEAKAELGKWLKVKRGGRPQKEVSEHFPSKTGGLTGCVANWEKGYNLPTWEVWLKLKEILGLDDRYDYMIEGRPANYIAADREILESKWRTPSNKPEFSTQWGYGANTDGAYDVTAPSSPQAKALDGSYAGFQPKPAVEVIIVAMKPLSQKTFVDQALDNGKGISWLDRGRIPYDLQGSDLLAKICVCLQNPIQSSVNNAESLKNQDEPVSVLSSAQENVDTNRLENLHGTTVADMSKTATSCLDGTTKGNTDTSLNMFGSGKSTRDQFQKVTKSTTSTETNKTTGLKICNVCLKPFTLNSIEQELGTTPASGRFPANLLVSDDVLNDGVERKTGNLNRATRMTGFADTKEWKEKNHTGDSGSYSRYFDLDKWNERNIYGTRITKEDKRLTGNPEFDTDRRNPSRKQKGLTCPAETSGLNTLPFLIVPKASKSEKNKGLDGFTEKTGATLATGEGGGVMLTGSGNERSTLRKNHHPTVKPLKLMSYLITLFSREGDVVLDPFCGSGTTCIAAKELGREFIRIERESEYVEISKARLDATKEPEPSLF